MKGALYLPIAFLRQTNVSEKSSSKFYSIFQISDPAKYFINSPEPGRENLISIHFACKSCQLNNGNQVVRLENLLLTSSILEH